MTLLLAGSGHSSGSYARDLPNWCALYIRGVVCFSNMHKKQRGVLNVYM